MIDPPAHFRALARRSVSLQARISLAVQPTPAAARLVDLGLGGACIELGEALEHGTDIRLLIEAPHLWDPLALEARVTWARAAQGKEPARIGVQFSGASGKALRLVAELLEAQAFGL